MKALRLFSFFLLFFVSIATQAQKNLHAGYVVLNNNDTLSGFIDYKEWHRNPFSVLFSSTQDADLKKYTLNDLKSFEVNGKELYARYVIRISLGTELLSSLSAKDTTTKKDVTFLKVVQRGKNVDLFSYRDETKFRWYIKQSNEDTPQELLNSIYRNDRGIVYEREYRSQLLKIANNYLPITSEITAIISKNDYSKKSMLEICDRLNRINRNEINGLNRKLDRASPFRFFAGAGLNVGSLQFSEDNHYTGSHSSASYLPLLNGGVDIYVIPSVGRLYLHNNLIISGFRSSATAPTEYYFEANETYYFKMSQWNIAIHSQLSYNLYNTPRLKWFVGAGAGFNISTYPVNQETFVREGLNAATTVNESYIPTKKFWLNASMRSGIAIKNWELSLNYFTKSSISQYIGFSLDNSSFQLQINY